MGLLAHLTAMETQPFRPGTRPDETQAGDDRNRRERDSHPLPPPTQGSSDVQHGELTFTYPSQRLAAINRGWQVAQTVFCPAKSAGSC
jgi:hypothetical protein